MDSSILKCKFIPTCITFCRWTDFLSIGARLQKEQQLPIEYISLFVSAGLKGTIAKDEVFSMCRDILTTHIPRISLNVGPSTTEIITGARPIQQNNQHFEQLRRQNQDPLLKLIHQCLSADFQPELSQLVTIVTTEAMAKTRQDLEQIYWPFVRDLISHLHKVGIHFCENPELQRLFRIITKHFIELQISPAPIPPTPPKDWIKAARGCGCSEVCNELDQFLQNPNMESQYFKLLPEMQIHLRQRIYPPRLRDRHHDDDIRITPVLGGFFLAKIFPAWELSISKWKTDYTAWRESMKRTAEKFKTSIPESLLEKLLGQEVFTLRRQLIAKGMAPVPSAPAVPRGVKARLPAPLSHPLTGTGSNSSNLNISSPNKRSLPSQSPTAPPSKKARNSSSTKENFQPQFERHDPNSIPNSKPKLSTDSSTSKGKEDTKALLQRGIREERTADVWVSSWLPSRPPPKSGVERAIKRQLQVYSIWYHGNYSCEEIAKMLRDPPLQIQTVKGYICTAIQSDDLPYDRDKLKEMVKGMGYLYKFERLLSQLK